MRGRWLREGLSAPVTVTWEVTRACNLSCRHCLSSSGQPAEGELSLEAAKGLLDQLAEMGVFQVNLGGGEPFLRPDILQLLTYATDKGIVTCVSTNGTLITEDVARLLGELDSLYLQVSLDGATSATNDALRGPGCYEAVMGVLPRLQRHGLRLAINSVLTRINFHELDALYALARSYQARLRISRLRPSGRGRESWQALRPTREQLVAFHRWLRSHPDVLSGDSFFFLSALGEMTGGLNLCGAARLTCCISPQGNVYPCAFLQSDELMVGNVTQEPLSAIWQGSVLLQALRTRDPPWCKEHCRRFDVCHGGCAATAYHVTGSWQEPDAECVLRNRYSVDEKFLLPGGVPATRTGRGRPF